MNHRSQALSLYRSLLKVSNKWAADLERPGRSMKEHIEANVRDAFKKHMAERDPVAVESLLENGFAQLNALQILQANALSNKYPRDDKWRELSRAMFERRQLLSDSTKKMLAKPPSLFSRIFSVFRQKKD